MTSQWKRRLLALGILATIVAVCRWHNADAFTGKDNPVKLGDLFHTYLRALGINSHMNYKIDGQTNPVADPAAKPIHALLA